MPTSTSLIAVNTARDYYNSQDADRFYASIWGGEDIHIGLYESGHDSISDASRRTVARLASMLGELGPESKVLDVGSGYGGAARFLARTYGCHVTALNVSDVENNRSRALTAEQDLAALIDVVDGNFENIPYPEASFDVVWSQDALLHSGDRTTVLTEIARVLKPGGQLIFTDPMQTDDCPGGVLQPILDRIHLESLGSPNFYRLAADQIGFHEEAFEELTPHLITHYARVLEETENQTDKLLNTISAPYIERMKKGLRYWVDGGKQGYLVWGIFRFRKS